MRRSISNRSSQAASPRPTSRFDPDLIKTYMKKLLSSTLSGQTWPELKDRDKVRAWCREIGDRVKERMVEIEPRGFKYIVTTQINENRSQGGRAGLSCHWEDGDSVAQEMFQNETLIGICVAFAVRTP